jgi:peptidoglycan hydrolase-like protein with peptidoglycan-binding domain
VHKLSRSFSDPGAVLIGCAVGIVVAVALLLAARPAFAGLGDRDLRMGMRGPDVAELQRALTKLGFRTAADGAFGPGTRAGVRRYEKRYRERRDGVVTRPEGRRLRQRAATGAGRAQRSAPAGFGLRVLRQGMSGPDVRYLQLLLGRLGFATGVDGRFGPATEAKVRAWEASVNGLVDGVVSRGQAAEMLRRAASQSSAEPASPPAGGGQYVFPVRGPHSYGTSINRFGAPRSGHTHQGQDVLARAGTPLVAVTAGRVYAVGSNGGAGHYVVIAGDDRRDYAYYHLQSSATVSKGQRVSPGTPVGRVGCTGSCSGDHLHFEMWTPHWWAGGRPFDPLPYLKQWDTAT